ncbi:hypothetical protein L1887_62298 [Cichorium endivia]|nr:hypothetical protein L1887_62298 [Cichorium endivia]
MLCLMDLWELLECKVGCVDDDDIGHKVEAVFTDEDVDDGGVGDSGRMIWVAGKPVESTRCRSGCRSTLQKKATAAMTKRRGCAVAPASMSGRRMPKGDGAEWSVAIGAVTHESWTISDEGSEAAAKCGDAEVDEDADGVNPRLLKTVPWSCAVRQAHGRS